MELRMIRYFLQLCRDLSFTAAANKLYITQQALSKAIGKLEDELGAQLFIRGGSGLTLTEAGESFRQDVEPSFEALDRAYKKFQYAQRAHRVHIRFGYTLGLYSAIQFLIEDFCALYPAIEIVGKENTDYQCEQELQAGKQDIICITEPRDPTGTLPVYECPLVLIVAEGGPLDRELTPGMLSDNVLADCGTEFNSEQRIRAAFAHRGVNLTMKSPTFDKAAQYGSVRKGTCAMPMPQHDALDFKATNPGTTIRQFPFDKDESAWRLCLKFSENMPSQEEVRRFGEFLKAHIGESIVTAIQESYAV